MTSNALNGLQPAGITIPGKQSIILNELFDDSSAAEYVTGVSPRAIRDWRNKRGLPFIRISSKCIRIRRADLDKWLAQHRVAIAKGAGFHAN